MAITDPGYIRQLNIGYDLDGGGYTFTAPDDAVLQALPCVVWEQPNLDYTGGYEHCQGRMADLLAFAPNSGHFPGIEFPKSVPRDGGELKLLGTWSTGESDHECNCRGKFVETSGAAGEPQPLTREQLKKFTVAVPITRALLLADAVGWEFTGTSSDHPYPDCDRCEGDGYVKSSGGEWALYEFVQSEDSHELDLAMWSVCEHCGEDYPWASATCAARVEANKDKDKE